jgi:hypothetical protein
MTEEDTYALLGCLGRVFARCPSNGKWILGLTMYLKLPLMNHMLNWQSPDDWIKIILLTHPIAKTEIINSAKRSTPSRSSSLATGLLGEKLEKQSLE